MPYDEELAHRIRELIGERPDLTEKRMFGGLAFLVAGNMAIAASSQGGVLVRVDPEEAEAAAARPHASAAVMRGRRMRGWIRVSPAGLKSSRELEGWVRRGVDYARSLPAK